MKIQIDNRTIEIKEETEPYFTIIQKVIDKAESYLDYLIIDGTPVYNNFSKYIEANKTSIEKIEIVTQTLNELIVGIFISTNQYVVQAIPFIHALANDFNGKCDDKAWLDLIDLIEALEWMVQIHSKVEAMLTENQPLIRYGAWSKYSNIVSKISAVLLKFEELITKENQKETGKLLINEIIPIYEAIELQSEYLKNYMQIYI